MRQPTAMMDFDSTIAVAMTAADCWAALERLAAATCGHKLFTVTTVDLGENVARRLHTSNPVAYPVSGSKPIVRDRWFEIVHGQGRMFVANTIAVIAKVFPDHETIASLGCGSVVNLPVVLKGQLVATINMLHKEHFYTPERVATIEATLPVPAKLSLLAARALT